ncbi:UNVERIFIED_CONTAM: hypothetical protein GTU68_018351 [Idotea baltica]|nr:hypothetical protein [Idotea baltica]
MNLTSKSEKGDSLIILESSDADSFAFFNSVQKYSSNQSDEQLLSVPDGSNFPTISGPFNPQIGQSFKDIVVVGPDEENVDLSRLYFLVSSDDHQLLGNEVSATPSINTFALPQEHQIKIDIKDEPIFTVISEKQNNEKLGSEETSTIELFPPELNEIPNKLSTTSVLKEHLIGNVAESKRSYGALNDNMLTIEDRLSKRDSLLPQKPVRKPSKRKITCDKCKIVFSSPSQYYYHRNTHMQRGKEKTLWSCGQCGKEFKNCKTLKSHELKEHGEVRMYPCPHCIHSFPKLLLLDHHIRNVHKGEKQFECKLCGHKFFRLYDLKTHLNIHFNIKSHVCHYCGRQFSHSSNLLRHLRVHTNVKPYSCNLCGRRFSQMPSMLAHRVSHTSGGSCSDCMAKFHSIAGFRNHMKNVHKKNIGNKEIQNFFYKNPEDQISRLYNCIVCSERFRFKKGLEIHEKIAHSNKSFPCKSCLKIFPCISYFKFHPCVKREETSNSKSDTFECVHCHKCFGTFEESEIHVCKLEIENENFQPEEANEIGVSIEKVDSCDETVVMYINVEGISAHSLPDLTSNNTNETLVTFLNSSNDLRDGDEKDENLSSSLCSSPVRRGRGRSKSKKKENTKESQPNLLVESKKGRKKMNSNRKTDAHKSSDNLFKCTQCWKTFTKKWNWRQHLGTHDASLRRYICDECGKSFSYRSTYTTHLKVHSKGTLEKFCCSLCTKIYNSKNVLDQHIKRVHNKQCNYLCTVCSKGFYNKSDYSYHMRIHRKELPFVCFACGKGFAHLSHIHRHEKIHTGERPHKCPYCPKSFIQSVTLRIHLKKHEDVRPKDQDQRPIFLASDHDLDDVTPGENEEDIAVIKLEEMPSPDEGPSAIHSTEMTQYSIDIHE